MNTYFYAASESKCQEDCSFKTCTRRCLSLLDEIKGCSEMVVLPGGSRLQTPTSMELRSGDLLILYAGDKEDLDSLLSMKDDIDTFRVVLIVGEEKLIQIGLHYRLTPHYTISLNSNLNRLGLIIDRMSEQPNPQMITDKQLEETTYG